MLVIDWSKVPKGYDWAAQDEDGCVYAYMNRPVISCEFTRKIWRDPCKRIHFIREGKKNLNFHKTLAKRPEK